jgi:hypothetical protein
MFSSKQTVLISKLPVNFYFISLILALFSDNTFSFYVSHFLFLIILWHPRKGPLLTSHVNHISPLTNSQLLIPNYMTYQLFNLSTPWFPYTSPILPPWFPNTSLIVTAWVSTIYCVGHLYILRAFCNLLHNSPLEPAPNSLRGMGAQFRSHT